MTTPTTSKIYSHEGPLSEFKLGDPKASNWPVVYVLDDAKQVYVGESLNVMGRFSQHQKATEKQNLNRAHVLVDPTFNKSAALDLESSLVRLLAGDGQFEVLNRNDGIVDADYYDRETYREKFDSIFEDFQSLGIFTRPISEIENSNLFKLSPFKSLNPDQEQTIQSFLASLLASLSSKKETLSVIQGGPGTGKTVVGIYLIKLLTDLGKPASPDDPEDDSVFADPYVAKHRDLLSGLRIALVVPQQSLRESIKRVFKKTPGLDHKMVMTPFEVGEAKEKFDLVVVDETHRLNRRAPQFPRVNNVRFAEINQRLFGGDDPELKNQIDWIVKQSKHQLFLLDAAQSVRPADIPAEVLNALVDRAERAKACYPLKSQMRVKGEDYVEYVRAVFDTTPPKQQQFANYDLRWFEDLAEMEAALREKEKEDGLSRMVAGFAWPWLSKGGKDVFDIEIDGVRRKWNTTDTDWVQSKGAPDEVGSIHTVQGYDLNYAGVIIGNDLWYDADTKRISVDPGNYFDRKGKQSSQKYGYETTPEDLLNFVINVYVVLLTRGIKGTYVYVCDPQLREYLRDFFDASKAPSN